MAAEKSTNEPRIHPRKYSEVFLATECYQRPLELWPFEYQCFEELAGAVEELARLDSRAGEGTLGSTLKIISNELLDLVVTRHRRYQEQEAERKAAEARKKAKPKHRPQGGNVKDFSGAKKGEE